MAAAKLGGGRVKLIREGEFDTIMSKAVDTLVVVNFSGASCGPCIAFAPEYERMAAADPTVLFLKLIVEENRNLAAEKGIRAMPTFQLYINRQMVEEFQGADGARLKAAIATHKAKVRVSFSGAGHSLGGVAADPVGGPSAAMMADALAKRLGAAAAAAPAPAPAPAAAAPASAPVPAPAAAAAAAAPPRRMLIPTHADVTPLAPAHTATPPVDPEALASLLSMGFAEDISKAALAATNGDIDAAAEWVIANMDTFQAAPAHGRVVCDGDRCYIQEDEDVSMEPTADVSMEPTGDATTTVPPASSEITASEQAHLDSQAAADAALPLEERLARVQERLNQLKAQKAEAARKAQIQAELDRRANAQKMAQTREQLDAVQRQRDIDAKRREKEAQLKERERLRQELLKDRINRAAAEGKTIDVAAAMAAPAVPPEKRVEGAITLLQSEGAAPATTALKTIRVLIKNVLDHPEEAKFCSINLANAAVKERVVSKRGGLALLRAAGFKEVGDDSMLISQTRTAEDNRILHMVVDKIDRALR